MSAVTRALWNPIVAKEYRSRMRTWRSPLAMTTYILLLGGIGWSVFASMANSAQQNFSAIGSGPNYAVQIFEILVIFQMALVAFITPALTSGAISGERERQTLDLLFVTRIPPFSLIWGKFLASMSFVVLLLILSVPIFSLVFLFGGVELDQMATAFAVIGMTAVTLGMVGIALSTVFRRTLTATVAAYAATFVLLAGTLLYAALFPPIPDPQATVAPGPPAVSLLSPFVALTAIATNGPPQLGLSSSISGGGVTCNATGACFPTGVVACPPGVTSVSAKGVGCIPSAATGSTIPTGLFAGWQYWQATVVLQLALCVVALVFSAYWLPPVRRLPWRRLAHAPEPDEA